MKKFITRILLFLLVLLSLSATLIGYTKYSGSALSDTYNRKIKILEMSPSPRIIFVAGSSILTSLDAKRISDSLHLAAINLGLHAGVGLKYMVDDVALYIRPGDIVVFAPEYHQFYSNMYGTHVGLSPIILSGNPEKWKLLNRQQALTVVRGMWLTALNSYRTSNRDRQTSGMDECGDGIGHWHAPDQHPGIKPANPLTEKFDKDFALYFIKKVEEIEKTATVVIVPPVIIESAYHVFQGNAAEISAFLEENRHPYRVAPEYHALPDSMGYNTYYHMNYDGVSVFTDRIIGELAEIIPK